MEPSEIDRIARALYEGVQTPKPAWEALGAGELGTQGAWRDIARGPMTQTKIHGYVVLVFPQHGFVSRGDCFATLEDVARDSTLRNGRGGKDVIGITTTFEILQWAQANRPQPALTLQPRERKRVIRTQESDHPVIATRRERTVVDVPQRERKRVRGLDFG